MSGVYPAGAQVRREASLSADGAYRYCLTREWGEGVLSGRTAALVTFVMLNPSTADADRDDPTIRRCVSFARSWGFDGLRVVNLYAFRATKPADLWRADDPTGGERNDDLLAEVGHLSCREPLVAAWGAHARPERVAQVLAFPGWDRLVSLGTTKAGAPRHPLYVKATTALTAWPPRCGDADCDDEHGDFRQEAAR